MSQLTWNSWKRSDGCRKWMDKTTFGPTNFTDIFWRGMRYVFMDEGGHNGLLYTGGIGIYANQIINQKDPKGVRQGFTVAAENRMLWSGDFHYNDPYYYSPNPPTQSPIPLLFEGPDKKDLNSTIYATGDINASRICVQFYNIVKDAKQGTGAFQKQDASGKWHPNPVKENEAGVIQLAYFTGAHVLAGIMNNHGFFPYTVVNGKREYVHTLPELALQATLIYAKIRLEMDGIDNSALPTKGALDGSVILT